MAKEKVETVEEIKPEPEIEVVVEGEPEVKEEAPKEDSPKQQDDDIVALKKQLDDLRGAQSASQSRAQEAERLAQQAAAQITNFRQNAEQSQYDSILTAIGASQMEVDSAKRDIVYAGQAQDFEALANAQERLSAAKTRMVSLEMGKENYDRQREYDGQQPQEQPRLTTEQMIDRMDGLRYEERIWLKQHPEAISSTTENKRLDAAYQQAVKEGLERGSPQYFDYIETKLGYKSPEPVVQERENTVMVAAPVSRNVPSGKGGEQRHTLTKEEAEIAKLSGITPAEYVKQRQHLQFLKKDGHYNTG